MKVLEISKGKQAIVDSADFERVSQNKWFWDGRYVVANPYSKSTKKQEHIYLHRFILGTPKGMVADHINGNTLDNRQSNLRNCSWSDNARNRRKPRVNKFGKTVTSQYKGVHWRESHRAWVAYIKVNGRTKFIGNYKSEEDAARAYNRVSVECFGEYANVNIV